MSNNKTKGTINSGSVSVVGLSGLTTGTTILNTGVISSNILSGTIWNPPQTAKVTDGNITSAPKYDLLAKEWGEWMWWALQTIEGVERLERIRGMIATEGEPLRIEGVEKLDGGVVRDEWGGSWKLKMVWRDKEGVQFHLKDTMEMEWWLVTLHLAKGKIGVSKIKELGVKGVEIRSEIGPLKPLTKEVMGSLLRFKEWLGSEVVSGRWNTF
jgi:hypothetical protein